MFQFESNQITVFNPDEYNKHVYISLEINFPNNSITAYFKNGKIYKVKPYTKIPLNYVAGYANKARFIVSDGKKYDLSNIESVNSIPIPKYNSESKIGVTGMLEYILKMHPYTDDLNLNIAIMDKAISMMDYSVYSYSIDTYLQFPRMLYEKGLFELGDEKLSKILYSAKYAYEFDALKLKNYRDYHYKRHKDPNSVPKSFSAYMRKLNKQNCAKKQTQCIAITEVREGSH